MSDEEFLRYMVPHEDIAAIRAARAAAHPVPVEPLTETRRGEIL
jgi:hypothetical protein